MVVEHTNRASASVLNAEEMKDASDKVGRVPLIAKMNGRYD